MSFTVVLVHFGYRIPLTASSPRALCFQSQQASMVTQLALGCFGEPVHPSLDEVILVSLVDGHERPSNLISVDRWGYGCGSVRHVRGHGERCERNVLAESLHERCFVPSEHTLFLSIAIPQRMGSPRVTTTVSRSGNADFRVNYNVEGQSLVRSRPNFLEAIHPQGSVVQRPSHIRSVWFYLYQGCVVFYLPLQQY